MTSECANMLEITVVLWHYFPQVKSNLTMNESRYTMAQTTREVLFWRAIPRRCDDP